MPTALNRKVVKNLLPRRAATAHKGSFGTVGLLCGSEIYRGAALLCAEGAMRLGAGIVRLASVEAVCAAAAVRLPGCVLLPLPAGPDGVVAPPGAALLLEQKNNALLAGCGLGRGPHTAPLVATLLGVDAPLVLDADALFALAEDAALCRALAARRAPTVLTPHVGEMARLLGQSTPAVQAGQADAAAEAARRFGCTVVLKSHATVVAGPGDAQWLLDDGGNPGLAKGGSGDVLAGMVAALLGQGAAAGPAAAAAVWLHAQAGHAAARALGQVAMLPQDLPGFLPRVLRGLEQDGTWPCG